MNGTPHAQAPAPNAIWLGYAVPALFVLLWSTGFVVAKLGIHAAEAATFLVVRFAIVVPLLVLLAVVLRSRWPGPRLAAHAAVVGVLMHVVYLGGVFAAIEKGVPAGVAAVIVGLQPLLTATVVGPVLGERVTVDGKPGVAVPLRVDAGRLRIGPVQLGALPPLF